MAAEDTLPGLCPEHFISWKKRFEAFVRSKSLRVWRIIEFGDYIPRKVSPDGNGEIVKPECEWSEDDETKVAENHLAIHLLYSALSEHTFQLVFRCDTAHDIWKTLAVIYEGNSQLKECKIDLLTRDFENFQKSKYDYIDYMYARYNRIISSLKALGKTYTNKEYVERFLSALPCEWTINMNTILENTNICEISLEDLIGTLKVYEFKMLKNNYFNYIGLKPTEY